MRAVVREEVAGDAAAIHRLNADSFETAAEAKLVDALRAVGALTLSLVAEIDDEVVGHIAFSPVVVESAEHKASGVGLAPMAVARSHRRHGVGGTLIREGLQRLRHMGHRFCVVLGHAEYYPRHGFVRASEFGLRWERPVPDDVFFVCELATGGLAAISGVVRYRPEFDAV